MKTVRCVTLAAVLGLVAWGAALQGATAADNPFLGGWALTIPGGGAGWLGVEQTDGQLSASILWGGGSVLPVSSAEVSGDKLIVKRVYERTRRGGVAQDVETIEATIAGDQLNLTTKREDAKGNVSGQASFTGKRIPPLPPAPDLRKVEFGDWAVLFDGSSMEGWKPMNPSAPNGWRVENGVLVNEAKQEPGKHVSYANLQTEQQFEDFQIALEVRVPEGGNSGVYLRGIYEVQVSDSYGRDLDSHNMGAVYSRITPTVSAEKPAGQWQTLDITLADRHVTVILNGQTIIDNQPLLGCTGGAIWSDQFRPGPLYLQGDHTSVDYRNIRIRPVLK